MKINQHDAAMDDFDIQRERAFSGAGRIVLICSLLFLILGIWAWFGRLDEVSTGNGKVIPVHANRFCSRWMAAFWRS